MLHILIHFTQAAAKIGLKRMDLPAACKHGGDGVCRTLGSDPSKAATDLQSRKDESLSRTSWASSFWQSFFREVWLVFVDSAWKNFVLAQEADKALQIANEA